MARRLASLGRAIHAHSTSTAMSFARERTRQCAAVSRGDAMLFSPLNTKTGYRGMPAMTNNDPRSMLATSPMSQLQIIVCTITVFLNALDGFDLLAISFATP